MDKRWTTRRSCSAHLIGNGSDLSPCVWGLLPPVLTAAQTHPHPQPTLVREHACIHIYMRIRTYTQLGYPVRFTCWNQFTNRRYENEGTRIDYTIIDRSLLRHLDYQSTGGNIDPSSMLRCPCPSLDPLSERAALCAATSNGRFQPVSYQGEGIMEPSQDALDSQFGPPHTGMVYTPPSFSDHIGVSILFRDTMFPSLHNRTNVGGNCNSIETNAVGLVLNDKSSVATRKAQPHKKQKSLASYFQTQPRGERSVSGSASISARKLATHTSKASKLNRKRKAGTILSHFQSRK